MTATEVRRIGEVAVVFNGKTPSKSEQRDSGHPVLKIKDVDALGRFQGTFSGHVRADLARKHVKQQLNGGETLVLNAAHNATHVASKTFYADQEVAGSLATGEWLIVRWSTETVDSRFGNHWINAPDTRFRIRRLVNGIHLYPKDVARLQIPLPPLAEQKRIAAILDEADALRAKRREALAQLDTLLQSTFLDMFGDPVTNPMGWEQCVVGDVVHAAKDGPHVSPTYAESGVPFLSTRHIKPGEVVWEDLKYIDQDEANRQWKKCKPEFGDILYTKGGTTGIAARVTTSEPFAVWVHVALLKLIVKKVHPIWIEAMLNSAYCYTQSQRYTHGIANRDLGLKRMIKIQMYLPPLAEQRDFSAIVESIEQQKVSQRAHLAELDTLFASLQSRAFRGEL